MIKFLHCPFSSISASPKPQLPPTSCSVSKRLAICSNLKPKLKVNDKLQNDTDPHHSPFCPLQQAKKSSFDDTTTTTSSISQVLPAVTPAFFSAFLLIIANPLLSPLAKAAVEMASDTSGNISSFEFLTSAWAGFLAGFLHTLSGPDHLVALAPLSIGRNRTESAIVGALWGCGHDAGQMIFALLFFLLKDQLHLDVLDEWSTRLVGLTLLTIGALGIKGTSKEHATCASLENNEHDSLDPAIVENKRIGLATFLTGIVHGLQPDAFLVVLPALTLPSRATGAAFLVAFLGGTVIAMGSYTVFIGSCSRALEQKAPRITEKITLGSSLAAVVMGIVILSSETFEVSLF